MTGPELRALRQRYSLTLQNIADLLGLKRLEQVYHWEKEYFPIPQKHQIRLAVLFLDFARRRPPTAPCLACGGSGLAHAQEED